MNFTLSLIIYITSFFFSFCSGSGPLGSVVAPERKASARTQRAQKMHAAYLKSAGLGDFTPEKSQYQREEKPSGVSWNKKHEDDDRAF